MEEIIETMNFADDATSFSPFSNEDHFEFGGKGKARRAARQEAKVDRKAARTDKKLAKADLKRSKGQAKIIAAQNGTKTGVAATVGNVLGGIAKVVMPGAGTSSEESPAETASTSSSAESTDVSSAAKVAGDTSTAPAAEGGGMSKKMKMGLYIGGGVLLVGVLALVFLLPKKTA